MTHFLFHSRRRDKCFTDSFLPAVKNYGYHWMGSTAWVDKRRSSHAPNLIVALSLIQEQRTSDQKFDK